MMIRLSNGSRLALADDISAEMLSAQIEAAEADIERLASVKVEQEDAIKEMARAARRSRK